MRILAALLLFALPAMADVTATRGPWDLYRGTSIVQSGLASEAACLQAADDRNVVTRYTCRTRTTADVTADTVTTPVPVNCVVNDPPWVQGAVTPTVCPTSGQQSRTDTRTLTVLTQPANGGMACPALTQSTTVTVACVPPVTPPPVTGGNWDERSKAPGVIVAESFEGTPPPSCNGGWTSPGKSCYQAGNANRMAFDTAQHSSGAKALRLDFTGSGGAEQTGNYYIGWPQAFGQNSHYYVQYRMRLHGLVSSSAPWTSPNLDGEGWKTSLFAGINGPLCGNIELSTVNFYYENKLRLYTRCSGTAYDNFEFPQGGAQQQGDFTCKYEDSDPQAHCAMFHGDAWMTLYYDVQIGTYGSKNSNVKAYVDYCDGKGMKQWINAPNYTLDGPGAYGVIDLTLYTTKKQNNTPAPAVYSAWYDDVIVSSQPIVPAACN